MNADSGVQYQWSQNAATLDGSITGTTSGSAADTSMDLSENTASTTAHWFKGSFTLDTFDDGTIAVEVALDGRGTMFNGTYRRYESGGVYAGGAATAFTIDCAAGVFSSRVELYEYSLV